MGDSKSIVADPQFLKIGGNAENIIIIQGNINDLANEFFIYSLNFKKSAHIITEHLFSSRPDISKLDTYFFSLAFLYRHSLELILKAIGFQYIKEQSERKKFIKETFHNMAEILREVSPFIQDQIENNRGGYNWLVSLFDDMSLKDKESDSFRYPFGITVIKDQDPFLEMPKKYGIKSFFDKQTHIDLIAFVCKMEVAFNILSNYYSNTLKIIEDYKKYKPLFLEEGGGYYGQSVVGYSYSRNRFYPYVKAYTESADILHQYMNKKTEIKGSLFIPMCYLYRNGIELAIKEILFEECSLDHQSAVKKIKEKKHSISALWNSIRSEVMRHVGVSDEGHLLNVEKYIKQLHDFDGASDKFRYPTNKDLQVHYNKPKKFDVDNVAGFFGQLSYFFHGVCLMMSAQNEMQADMEAEYRAQMPDEYDYSN
ncbi:hypothetical protein [Paenibacillus silagei]|uniref:LA2681-like HEPN domain-containing protein n=1 Tax=Paenibacillus silagei TaxID=1670801 RepID=A0ABS4NKD5_9BACL|nr:hypothetical protein [Paenibacillus silagei]MBP2110503.1 hypothetical protein [Paenibacillus silagei]